MNDEDELQPEELDTEEASEELETSEGLEEDSDSAPEDDQEAFSPLQQARFNAAIGKKVRQTRDQERRADDLERQLQKLNHNCLSKSGLMSRQRRTHSVFLMRNTEEL